LTLLSSGFIADLGDHKVTLSTFGLIMETPFLRAGMNRNGFWFERKYPRLVRAEG
jgi:hypothetical protein